VSGLLEYLFNEMLTRPDGRPLHSVHWENLENRGAFSGFHIYENWSPCPGPCDATTINAQLHIRPAMFTDDVNGVTDIPGIGPVRTDKDSKGILNTTLDGHRLKPGIVHRGYEERGGVGGIYTLGFGWGRLPWLNENNNWLWRRTDQIIFDRAKRCGTSKC
jgi:hypothetical protein